jgi:hypothetical protein
MEGREERPRSRSKERLERSAQNEAGRPQPACEGLGYYALSAVEPANDDPTRLLFQVNGQPDIDDRLLQLVNFVSLAEIEDLDAVVLTRDG